MASVISVKDDIIDALAALLLTVVTPTYSLNIRKVYKEIVPIGIIQDFPAVIINQGLDVVLKRTTGLLWKRLTVYLDCYLYSADLMQKEIRKMESALEKLFYADRYTTVTGGSVSNTAFQLEIVSSDPFGTQVTKPNGGTTVELAIFYHQRDTNPTEKA